MTRARCNLELVAVMSGVTAPAGRRPLTNGRLHQEARDG